MSKQKQWFKINNLTGEPGNQAAPRLAVLSIFEQIGEDWWTGQGVTAGAFIRAVDALGELDEIELHINTPGGDVMDGLTITNYLMQHPAKVVVRVDGQAASIGSVIMMAGDERIMGLGTTVFVHDPFTIAMGDAEELRSIADDLDKIRDGIIDVYMARTTRSRDDLVALMRASTRLTAAEAVEWGFATRTDSEIKAAACVDLGPVLAQAREQAIARGKAANVARSIERERDELKGKVLDLTTEIEALRRGPAPADAAAVIEACAAAKVPALAADFVKARTPMEQVTARLNQIAQVRDICAAAKSDPDAYIADLQDPVALVRLAVANVRAAADQQIDNHVRSGPHVDGKPGSGIDDIYRQRNANKIFKR